ANLSKLHDRPGGALLGIVQSQTDALKDVPGFLLATLAATLDELIKQAVFGQVPALDAIAAIIQSIGELSRRVEVNMTWKLSAPNPAGMALLEETVSSVGFRVQGLSTEIPLGANSPTAKLAVNIMPPSGSVDADLAIPSHSLDIPIGALLLT